MHASPNSTNRVSKRFRICGLSHRISNMKTCLQFIRLAALVGFIACCGLYVSQGCAYAQIDPVCGYLTCDAGGCTPCHIQTHRCGDTALCFDCCEACVMLTASEQKNKMILRAVEKSINPSGLTDIGALLKSQFRSTILPRLTTHQAGLPAGHPLVDRDKAFQLEIGRLVPSSSRTAGKCVRPRQTMFRIDPAQYGIGI